MNRDKVSYPTWAVSFWLSNDEQMHSYWDASAEEAWEHAEANPPFTRLEDAMRTLAEEMKARAEESMPEVSGMWADLLNSAFQDVEWGSIAADYLEPHTSQTV